MTWAQLHSGSAWEFLRPDFDEIDLRDIAHSLSMQCRWNGHTQRFYSVAEHCVLVAETVRRMGGTSTEVLAALLHDAPEAYLADLPGPLKGMLPEYQQIEWEHARCITVRFGLALGDLSLPIVVQADRMMLRLEGQQLITPSPRFDDWLESLHQPLAEPVMPDLKCLTPDDARQAFMDEAEWLGIA